MTQITPMNPNDPDVRSNVEHIMKCHPVQNLTEAEVVTTLRLLQLHSQLCNFAYSREVVASPKRLELCDDKDRFLAMLLDFGQRDLILCSKDLIRKFGGTRYHWRKIARACPVTSVASALSQDGEGGYYGRGWIIAPHIHTLRRWIIEHSTNPEIKKLRV